MKIKSLLIIQLLVCFIYCGAGLAVAQTPPSVVSPNTPPLPPSLPPEFFNPEYWEQIEWEEMVAQSNPPPPETPVGTTGASSGAAAGVAAGAVTVIIFAGATIYYEINGLWYQYQIIPDPTNPNLPPGYVGNTYDDDLYSPTPWLDNYWYYSPFNPANWPTVPVGQPKPM